MLSVAAERAEWPNEGAGKVGSVVWLTCLQLSKIMMVLSSSSTVTVRT